MSTSTPEKKKRRWSLTFSRKSQKVDDEKEKEPTKKGKKADQQAEKKKNRASATIAKRSLDVIFEIFRDPVDEPWLYPLQEKKKQEAAARRKSVPVPLHSSQIPTAPAPETKHSPPKKEVSEDEEDGELDLDIIGEEPLEEIVLAEPVTEVQIERRKLQNVRMAMHEELKHFNRPLRSVTALPPHPPGAAPAPPEQQHPEQHPHQYGAAHSSPQPLVLPPIQLKPKPQPQQHPQPHPQPPQQKPQPPALPKGPMLPPMPPSALSRNVVPPPPESLPPPSLSDVHLNSSIPPPPLPRDDELPALPPRDFPDLPPAPLERDESPSEHMIYA